jgi:hypothetical protein
MLIADNVEAIMAIDKEEAPIEVSAMKYSCQLLRNVLTSKVMHGKHHLRATFPQKEKSFRHYCI